MNKGNFCIKLLTDIKFINYEIYALVGCYAAFSGNSLLRFRNKISVPSSRVLDFLPFEHGADRLSRTPIRNYQYRLSNDWEEHRSLLHSGGSLKSSNINYVWRVKGRNKLEFCLSQGEFYKTYWREILWDFWNGFSWFRVNFWIKDMKVTAP
jgi:hypothetical protein